MSGDQRQQDDEESIMIETKIELGGCSVRESAATVLRDRARRLRKESDQLARLADFAEGLEMGCPQEEALWSLVVQR